VPVFSLIRTSVATALLLRDVPDGSVTEPGMAEAEAGTASTVSSTSALGPPVRTGTGSGVAYVVPPSTTAAYAPYAFFGSTFASSYATSKAIGEAPAASIRC
jgi:hypothetical protein